MGRCHEGSPCLRQFDGKDQGGSEADGGHDPSGGHDCQVEAIHDADPAQVSAADVICVGSWTKGLFVILQGPTKATLDFIDRLGPLTGKTAAVFTTYDLAIGRTLKKMAAPLAAKGANVTGEFKARGPHVAEGFAVWLETLRPTG